ncbi:MAG: hypothetical protein JWM95_2955 [Gemmatimonadetes bacterium]|nr:hypothetical protein [Gemmatimonadota bacterium]
MTNWQPFHESPRVTLVRTVGIALVAGAVFAHWSGGLARWPLTTAVMLWPSLGGHWLELWFLNWLRPRISEARPAQIGARLGVWFIGGLVLGIGMRLTVLAFTGRQSTQWLAWWAPGLAFIGIEFIVQAALQLRGRPSFFNGRG